MTRHITVISQLLDFAPLMFHGRMTSHQHFESDSKKIRHIFREINFTKFFVKSISRKLQVFQECLEIYLSGKMIYRNQTRPYFKAEILYYLPENIVLCTGLIHWPRSRGMNFSMKSFSQNFFREIDFWVVKENFPLPTLSLKKVNVCNIVYDVPLPPHK